MSGWLPRPLGYDAKGNLTSGDLDGTGAWAFGYDAENRLTSACKPAVSGTCPSPTVNASYKYDPLGRRVEKSGAGVTKTWFVNDGDDEIAEYGSGNTPTVIYILGPAIDEPALMVTGFGGGGLTHAYFHVNHQGSVISMSDDNGNKVEGPYTYDPYGNCFSSGSPCSSSGEPYRFTGRRLDPETGLYFYRARYYWANGGRFLQTDPVGYTADLNLYTYGANAPTDNTDPTGNACYGHSHTCGDYGDISGVDASSALIGSSDDLKLNPGIIGLSGDIGPSGGNPAATNTGEMNGGYQVASNAGALPGAALGAEVGEGIGAIVGLSCGPGAPLCEAGTLATGGLAGAAIGASMGSILTNKHGDDTADRPPAGSKPIDKTPWSGDHGTIKAAIGAKGRDKTRISPAGDVWGQNPNGTWTNYGPAKGFTGSDKPSGRRGKDRDKQW